MSYTTSDETAMPSAEPVEVIAMKGIVEIITAPNFPKRCTATAGGTRACLAGCNRQLQSYSTDPQRSGERKWDGKPHEATQQIIFVGGRGSSRYGRLPVGLVDEDRAKVPNNVDDTKLQTTKRVHCRIRTVVVIHHGTTRILLRIMECRADRLLGEKYDFAVFDRVFRHGLQSIMDGV